MDGQEEDEQCGHDEHVGVQIPHARMPPTLRKKQEPDYSRLNTGPSFRLPTGRKLFSYYERKMREKYTLNNELKLVHRGFMFFFRFVNEKGNRSDLCLLSFGVQQSLKERLISCVSQILEMKHDTTNILQTKLIRVKLTGDGTQFGRRRTFINFGFTIPDDVLCPLWSVNHGARTIEEITVLARKKSQNLNCVHTPLFDFIPLWRRVPDMLHLYLRISDQLVKHLISELRLMDNIARCTSIYTRERFEQNEVLALDWRCKRWVATFGLVYQSKDVTPYMHILAYHITDMLKIHGNLVTFSQQGFEKLNDSTTKWYFRSTSHKGREDLKQIILKQNRLE
ncbi:uncharacterized protein [Haliotis cracherodii]|uniref:uncharacterized protein n=1 Tax=Haliotis cracherodii TaxID=6455 RepID=UPI0039EAC7E6